MQIVAPEGGLQRLLKNIARLRRHFRKKTRGKSPLARPEQCQISVSWPRKYKRRSRIFPPRRKTSCSTRSRTQQKLRLIQRLPGGTSCGLRDSGPVFINRASLRHQVRTSCCSIGATAFGTKKMQSPKSLTSPMRKRSTGIFEGSISHLFEMAQGKKRNPQRPDSAYYYKRHAMAAPAAAAALSVKQLNQHVFMAGKSGPIRTKYHRRSQISLRESEMFSSSRRFDGEKLVCPLPLLKTGIEAGPRLLLNITSRQARPLTNIPFFRSFRASLAATVKSPRNFSPFTHPAKTKGNPHSPMAMDRALGRGAATALPPVYGPSGSFP